MSGTVMLRHNRVELALHHLREVEGRPLLLLHGLGEASPPKAPGRLATWPGPVWALDFTGHGGSTIPAGGGYTPEVLLADVDVALAHIGAATLYGRGLGAYVALLVAGARPQLVKGAILDDGPGLIGGGPTPPSPLLARIDPAAPRPPDPLALVELSHDVRPPDYAANFVRQSIQLGSSDPAVSVCAKVRPEWLDAVVAEYGVVTESLDEALARFA